MIFFKPETKTYVIRKREPALHFELNDIAPNVLVFQKDIQGYLYLNAFGLKLWTPFVWYKEEHIELLLALGIIELHIEK